MRIDVETLRKSAELYLQPPSNPMDEDGLDEEDDSEANDFDDDDPSSPEPIDDQQPADIIAQIGGDFLREAIAPILGDGDLTIMTVSHEGNVSIYGTFTFFDEESDMAQAINFSQCADVPSWEELAVLVDDIIDEIESEIVSSLDDALLFDL